MRGFGSVWLALAIVLAVAPEAAAQERGGSTTEVKPPKKDKKHKKPKRTKKVKKPKLKSSGTRTGSMSYVEIDVRSQPRGATIVVDGERVGKAPVKVRVPTGRRVISAKLSGHITARTTVKATSGMGFMVFSLARETATKAPKVANKKDKRRSSGFGASKLSHKDAMNKARMSLKAGKHSDALKYAEGALSKKSSDPEAKMIATIAACGVGDKSRAKQHLPRKRGSYREIAIKRCDRLGIQLQ